MRDLIQKLWQIAKANPRGFTVTVPDCEPVTTGWCIGHRDTQNSFGKKGLTKVTAHALETTGVVGGWLGYDGRYYFDTVIIESDARAALFLKEEHQQKAIFNLETGKLM